MRFASVVASWLIVGGMAFGQHNHLHAGAAAAHTDSTAQQVEQAANAVAWEMYTHYRVFHDYREVYRECKEMWAISRHCHDLLHNSINNTRLKSNVQDLHEVFQHLKQHVGVWNAGHGSELGRRMDVLGSALHHLMLDAGVLPRQAAVVGSAIAPPASPGPLAPGKAPPSQSPATSTVPLSLQSLLESATSDSRQLPQ